MIHGLVVHKSLDNDCQVLRYSNAALVYEHGLEFSILLCGLAQAAELWNASQLVNWPRVKIARPWSGKTVSFRSCFQHWHAVITCCFARCKKQLIYIPRRTKIFCIMGYHSHYLSQDYVSSSPYLHLRKHGYIRLYTHIGSRVVSLWEYTL